MNGNHKDINLSLRDNNSERCLFIFNRTEKIVHASYIITNLLPTQEPMRWNIREECHYLIRHVLPLKDIQDMAKMNEFAEKIQTSLFSLLSLYEISAKSQVLSEMNCGVITDELIKLSGEIKSLTESKESGYSFHQEELSLGSKYASLIFDNDYDDASSGGAGTALSSSNGSNKQSAPNKQSEALRRKLQQTKSVQGKNKNAQSGIFARNEKGTTSRSQDVSKKVSSGDRREKILSLIKDKKQVSIKDISNHIKDCSEKTIQRELLAMVEEGVLVKEGERRWSTYRLS